MLHCNMAPAAAARSHVVMLREALREGLQAFAGSHVVMRAQPLGGSHVVMLREALRARLAAD